MSTTELKIVLTTETKLYYPLRLQAKKNRSHSHSEMLRVKDHMKCKLCLIIYEKKEEKKKKYLYTVPIYRMI